MKKIIVTLLMLTIGMLGCNPGTPNSNSRTQGSCADLTKDGSAACIKKDAIAGKTCLWGYDSCYELTGAIKNFKEHDASFKAEVPKAAAAANLATDKVLGADHGEVPDWDSLCGIPVGSRGNGTIVDLKTVVESVTLNFKKDTNEVDIVLDCTRGGGGNKKAHSFTYEVKPAAGDALLFRLSSVGPALDGSFQMRPTKPKGNVLEFFTKADWLYSSKKALVYGITQLGKLDYRYDTTNLNGENDFNQALSYARDPAKGGGYNIAPTNPNSGNDVGAVSFVFTKI